MLPLLRLLGKMQSIHHGIGIGIGIGISIREMKIKRLIHESKQASYLLQWDITYRVRIFMRE